MPPFSHKRKQKPPPANLRDLKFRYDTAEPAGRRSNSDQLGIQPPASRRNKSGHHDAKRKGASADDACCCCCCCCYSSQINESEEELPVTGLEPKFPRFGPIYGDDIEANRTAKDQAWEHIFEKISDDESEKNNYLGSIAMIEMSAKKSYEPSVSQKWKPSEFRSKMARDGCFFLQVALHILGGGDLLGYPEKHPYLGKDKDIVGDWIPAMFFARNQIPYDVIRALMKQDFFQKVISEGIQRGIWRQPPTELPKLVLYRIVVEPELEKPRLSLLFSKLMLWGITPHFREPEPPSDILHALHTLLLGPGNDPLYSEIKEFRDLETGRDDGDIRFPSAGELLKSGIRLKKADRGISNIHFQDLIYRAYLHVPPFTIDGHTEHMFMSLVSYEQNMNESTREVSAYLRFMRDLCQTYKDFKILERRGIIQVNGNDKFKYTMVQMLNKIVTSHKSSNFTLNFRQTRHRIADYGGPPWRLISFFIGVLTVVQTIFTILSYFLPPN